MHLLINADFKDVCFENGSVKTIITDPPYGITQNGWDSTPADFIEHCLKFLSQDFTIASCSDIKYSAFLLNKYLDIFSHDIVWKKTIGSGQLNINRQPLRLHELVLMFKGKKSVYNRIKTEGEPYRLVRKIETEHCYGKQKEHCVVNNGERDLTSIWEISNPRKKGGHPTQKPVELYQKLSDVYSIEGDVILDPFCGSGTVLDIKNRVTIGIEKEEMYYELARTSRSDRELEKEHQFRDEFQKFIPNLSNLKYTIFSSKS